MQVQAISKSVRISPRKVRLVADAIRTMPVESALASLNVMPKRAARAIAKTLQSAVANATNNAKLDRAALQIVRIDVSEGQSLKRFHPSTRGRIHPYKKRSSHIRIILEDQKKEAVK
jgi:large subunit ribosomal protein L22